MLKTVEKKAVYAKEHKEGIHGMLKNIEKKSTVCKRA